MFTVGHTTNDMAKSTQRLLGFSRPVFIPEPGRGDTAGMHLPVYKMNFPRKNPMKMAAMTTRREGREAVLASRPRRLVEFDVMWSERGIFLILIPSSCNRVGGVEKKTVNIQGMFASQEGPQTLLSWNP